jgi:putative acetyltransferase
VADRKKKRRSASVVVRAFEPSDVDALAPVFTQASVVADTLQLPFQSVQELRERWKGSDREMRVLVAEVSGKAIAMGSVHRSHRGRQSYVGSIGMAVSEQHRGAGVGGALLNALIEVAERWLGILRLELSVYVDNLAAIQLYRSRGFEVEGVARAFALRDGEAVDAFHMARVSENLPWPRITAEDVAQRQPPRLTAGFDPSKN